MVNELGEARYLRKLRGQSELWNVVEAILLGLICAAFTARMIALANDRVKVGNIMGWGADSKYHYSLLSLIFYYPLLSLLLFFIIII